MGKNAKYKSSTGLIVTLFILAGLVYGCYSKSNGPEKTDNYGQHIKINPLSETELRKFGESVRKVDGEAEARYKLALYFQRISRHKLAIDELKQVLLRDPAHAKAYNTLGVSCDSLSDYDSAIDYYKLALKIDSKRDYTYNNLGYSYLLKGDNERAVEAFLQAIALNGTEKRYRNNLGLAYVKQNKYELAYEQFNALDSSGNAEKTLAKLMRDFGKGPDTEKALLAIKSARKPEPSAEADERSDKLPELAATRPESASGNEPVERFRSMDNPITLSSGNYFEASGGKPQNSDQAETHVQEIAEDKGDIIVDVKEKSLAGPVINLSPTSTQNVYEIKIASAPPEEGLKEVAAENREAIRYYPVSSAEFPTETVPISQPESDIKLIDEFQEKLVVKKATEIQPSNIEIAAPMDQEKGKERLIVASSLTKVGRWQNAPEPKRTAERRLIEVEVANGNGVKSAAGKVAEHLCSGGFKVVKVMDANSFDHFNTKVFYYGSSLKEVQRLLKAIPEITGKVELYELQKMGNHIRLLIGKDLVEKNRNLTWEEPRSIRSHYRGTGALWVNQSGKPDFSFLAVPESRTCRITLSKQLIQPLGR